MAGDLPRSPNRYRVSHLPQGEGFNRPGAWGRLYLPVRAARGLKARWGSWPSSSGALCPRPCVDRVAVTGRGSTLHVATPEVYWPLPLLEAVRQVPVRHHDLSPGMYRAKFASPAGWPWPAAAGAQDLSDGRPRDCSESRSATRAGRDASRRVRGARPDLKRLTVYPPVTRRQRRGRPG
jgi:hypothetical protein